MPSIDDEIEQITDVVNDIDSSLDSDYLNDDIDDSYDESSYSHHETIEDSQPQNEDIKHDMISSLVSSSSVDESDWGYQGGFAKMESVREYEYFTFWIGMGRGRSLQYVKSTFNVSIAKLQSISKKNFWSERCKSYDRAILANKLAEVDISEEREHRIRLEQYRQKQEYLANLGGDAASKILALMQRKLNSMLQDTDNMSIGEMIGTGTLAVKLAELQKSLGSQALGVDALLEALEDEG